MTNTRLGPGRASPWWLLLTLPVALAMTLAGCAFMALGWCGVSGCSGGGFGRISDPSLGIVIAVGPTLVGIWFLALMPLPRPRDSRTHTLVSVIAAVAIAVLAAVVATNGFG